MSDTYERLKKLFSEVDFLKNNLEGKRQELRDLASDRLNLSFYGSDDNNKFRLASKFYVDEVRKVNKNLKLHNYKGDLDLEDSGLVRGAGLDFEKLRKLALEKGVNEEEILRDWENGLSYLIDKNVGFVKNGRMKVQKRDGGYLFLENFLEHHLKGADVKTVNAEGNFIESVKTFEQTSDLKFKDSLLARKLFIALRYGGGRRWE